MSKERRLLQDIVASSDANDAGSLMNAIQAASVWLAHPHATRPTGFIGGISPRVLPATTPVPAKK